MEQQNQQPIQEKIESKPPIKTNWKFIAIVALVAVILTVGGILLLKTTQPTSVTQTPPPSPQPQINDSSDFTLSEVQGWQTYRNDEFGFEVRYPEDFFKREYPSGIRSGEVFGISFADKKWKDQGVHNPSLTVSVIATELSPREWLEERYDPVSESSSSSLLEPAMGYKNTQDTAVNGRVAVKAEIIATSDMSNSTIIQGDSSRLYFISAISSGIGNFPQDTYDQILSTFRFVDKNEQPESQREYKREKLFSYLDYFPDRPVYGYDAIDFGLRFSPDGKHLAIYPFYDYTSRKSILIVDGKRIGSYDEVPGDKTGPFVKFSPDSNEIAYVVQTGEKSFVVHNNQLGKQYREAGYESGDSGLAGLSLEFSPDGKHLAYRVFDGQEDYFIKTADSFFIVFDGKEGKRYDDIVSGIVFSPDSKHFAYVANEGCVFEFFGYTGDRGNCYGGKSFIVKDGVEQSERHDFMYILGFSRDGGLLYAGSDGCPYAGGQGHGCDDEQKFFIVVQGKKMEISERPNLLEISSKGELVYTVSSYHPPSLGDWYPTSDSKLVWDGKSKEYPSAEITSLKFSPDGNHFAYVVRPQTAHPDEVLKKAFIVLDGQERKGYYDSVGSLLFSPDSKHFAYVGELPREGRRYAGSIIHEGLQTVVLDDQPLQSPDGMEYARIQNLHFSEDGSSIFYNARSGDSWYYIEELVE